jgi:hypothetical protein
VAVGNNAPDMSVQVKSGNDTVLEGMSAGEDPGPYS